MGRREIFITKFDHMRLEELINVAKEFGNCERADLAALSGELNNAKSVESRDVPADVVTMNSKVLLKDVDTSETMEYTLTFPREADISKGAISVLAPIGTAILGYSTGSIIEWKVPSKVRRISIEKILYQPEAAGDFHL